MAVKNVIVSDISGEEIEDGQVVELIVRSHPNLDEPKRFDVSASEVDGLKSATSVVTVEVKRGQEIQTVNMTLAEFDKVVPKKVLVNGAPTRGRRKGTRLNGNGGS